MTLHGSYEEAAAAVLRGESARLLVANAYHGVCAFYMDPRLTLELAFVQDTPKYGIAARAREPIPLTTRVATHPAPEDLVAQLLPSGYRVSAITYARSTSAAAAQVTSGDADLALTTEPAATLTAFGSSPPPGPSACFGRCLSVAPTVRSRCEFQPSRIEGCDRG